MGELFRSITFADTGTSPACVNRKTTDLYLNKNTWNSIEPAHRVFILCHEYAHCYLDTSDEKAVDAQAFEWYVKLGYPLTEAVKSLTRILDNSNKSHQERANLQLERAKKIDNKENFKNMNYSEGFLNKLERQKNAFTELYIESCNGQPCGNSLLDNLNGCQPGETPKACGKRMRIEGREEARILKAEGKRLKGEAEATLAEQGIVKPGFGAQLGGLLGKVADTVKDIKGAGAQDTAQTVTPKESKTLLYVGVGFLAVTILAVIFLVVKK